MSTIPKNIENLELTEDDFSPAGEIISSTLANYQRGTFYSIIQSFKENKMALACLIILLVIIISSLLASFSPYDPDYIDVNAKLLGASPSHWLGTDELGRDNITRALYGGRVSLAVGTAAMLVSVIVGTIIGAISGYVGGKVDMILMRIVDIFLSVPNLLLIIIIYAFIPPNIITLILMLSLFSWTSVARIVRAQTLTLKERDFVLAAKSLGVSDIRIIIEHIIPNMTSQIIVAASLSIANAILDESALSFLGYGVQIPKSSWGSMLQSAQKHILYDPLLAIVPGLFILLTVLCFNIIGDTLQHALDPKSTK